MKRTKTIEDIILLLIYLIIVGTGLYYCLSCYEKFILPKQVFFQIVLSFAFVIWLFKIIADKKIILKSGIIYPVLFLVVVNLISMFFSRSFYLSEVDIVFILSLVVLFVILIDILNNDVRIEGIVNVISVVCIVVCAVGILQFFGIDITGVVKRELVEAEFLSTTFGYRNYLGEYLGLVLPLFSLLSLGRRYFTYLSFICLVVLVILNTRAVWIGTFLSFLFCFVCLKYLKGNFLKEYFKKILLIFLLLILTFSTIFMVSKKHTEGIINRVFSFKTFKGSSLEERLLFWKVAGIMFKENPCFGKGLGNFKLEYLNYYEKLPQEVKKWAHTRSFPRQHPSNVHNEFLQILAETGIFGLFAFLWFGVCLFFLGFSILRNENVPPDYKILATGILSGFLFISFCAFFGFPFHIPQTSIVLIVLSSILVNIKERENAKEIKIQETSVFLKILLVLLLPFLVYYFSLPFLSSLFLEKGMHLQYRGKYKEAISMFDKAIQYNPQNGKAYFYRGVAKRSIGDYKGSIQDLLGARNTVEDIVVRFNIALGFVHIGDFKNAEKEYQKILDLDLFPEYQLKAHYEISLLYQMMGKKEKSEYHRKKFLEGVKDDIQDQ